MWPPIEAGPSNIFWGLPILIWAILIGCFLIFLLILASLFLYFYFLPRHRKILLSQTNYVLPQTAENGNNCIMSQSYYIENPMGESSQCYQPATNCSGIISSGNCTNHTSIIPETHKSMWAVNSFYDSNQELNDNQSSSYRTRSLPSWSKGKPRPASTVDDLEELYAQVNFTKKRRNRMRNDNAAIIARCRSRSQNLTSMHLEGDGIVVYDERTAL